ncbi:MAG: acyl-CoA thioesterase/BAAT N-terminal domain-containing protein [Candidatus Dormibacteria bacterium]
MGRQFRVTVGARGAVSGEGLKTRKMLVGLRLALASVMLVVAACSGGPTAASVSLVVAPAVSVADQPLDVTVEGLGPWQSLKLRTTSTDFHKVMWRSEADFAASSLGRLDLAKDASRSGSYSGSSGSGLLWSMHSDAGATAYFWGPGPMTFTVQATVDGHSLARASFQRSFGGGGYSVSSQSLYSEGFVGRFDSPPPGHPHTALLLLGGSEGGLPGVLLQAHLAASGYPTLALAYFNMPGLPSTLSNVPLEYFATALQWLAKQPGVDPANLIVVGASRGGEAALLLGTNYPKLVHGVVASVPSNVAVCSFPGCEGAAWTLNGTPIPFTREFNDPAPRDVPTAVIPVELMHASVFLDCGGADQVWMSCPYARAVIDRLDAHGYPFPHELHAYPDAGHGVSFLVPYEPGLLDISTSDLSGRSPDANERARQLLWPKVMAFLASVSPFVSSTPS